MDVQPIVSPFVAIGTKIYEIGKIGVYWCGHIIKTGYTSYVIPAAEKLSALAFILFKLFQKFVQTGPGIIFGMAAALLLIGITAFKFADRKVYEEDRLAKTAWKTAGIAAFISATTLTSFGLFALLI